MKKFFLFAAAALMALVGCEKQTQSEMDFAGVQSSGKVSGQLVYYADKAGASTQEVVLPGQEVRFIVDAAKYANNAQGNQVFSATTDSTGFFEITVPTGMKSITGDLVTDIIVLGEGANRIFLQPLDNSYKNITVLAGENKAQKAVVKVDALLTANQGVCTVKGKVTYDAGIVEKDGNKEEGVVAAPDGTKVTIDVTYKYKKGTGTVDEKRAFVVAVKNGEYSYNVPVPTSADDKATADIEVDQFAGKYTEDFNNGLLSVDALFEATAATAIALNDGETEIKDFSASVVAGSKVYPQSKNTKIKVKGELTVDAEVFEYYTGDDAKKIKSLKKDKAPYTPEINGGAFELIITYKRSTADEASIIYNLKVDEEGKYSKDDILIYDAWNFDDIDLTVRVKKFVYSDYAHYYWKSYKQPKTSTEESEWQKYDAPSWYQDWTDKTTFTNHYGTQPCEGTYEAKENAIPVPYDGFFAAKVDNNLTFTMSADAKEALYGVGNDADKMKDKNGTEYTIYGGGKSY